MQFLCCNLIRSESGSGWDSSWIKPVAIISSLPTAWHRHSFSLVALRRKFLAFCFKQVNAEEEGAIRRYGAIQEFSFGLRILWDFGLLESGGTSGKQRERNWKVTSTSSTLNCISDSLCIFRRKSQKESSQTSGESPGSAEIEERKDLAWNPKIILKDYAKRTRREEIRVENNKICKPIILLYS